MGWEKNVLLYSSTSKSPRRAEKVLPRITGRQSLGVLSIHPSLHPHIVSGVKWHGPPFAAFRRMRIFSPSTHIVDHRRGRLILSGGGAATVVPLIDSPYSTGT